MEGANGLSPAAGPQAATLGWANAGNSGYVFDVDTASVWQNFVVDSLGGSSGKPDVIHPWKLDGGVITGLGRGMQPDFVRVVDGKPPCCPYELIVDAKYNFCPAKKPTAAVQRQMYVYANESESGFKCFKCRVIYLKNKSKDKAGTATDLYAFYNSSDKLASLRCIGMKFPGPQNVKDAFKWQTYRRRFRKVLKRIHGT